MAQGEESPSGAYPRRYWWQSDSWRERQSKLDGRSAEVKQDRERIDRLLRHFNPACFGKHDRTSFDVMHCSDCERWTLQALMQEKAERDERRRARAGNHGRSES